MLDRTRKTVIAGAAVAALGLGGSAMAGAASNTSTTTSSSSTATQSKPAGPAHGTAAHESAEKAVTGADAAKAQAAAVKSVGSGTAGDVTTDMTGKGYETTVTKSDGSKVEVHLDSAFSVSQGGPGGGPAGDGDGPNG
jgi:nicotinic acid phosphoribosyltransferase